MNLYVHFPFCRSKCAYCALLSRVGTTDAQRMNHVGRIVRELPPDAVCNTVYFGGGTPAMCDLREIFNHLKFGEGYEFTVELHPLDVTDATLHTLRRGGVNRISLGVQSFDDEALASMGRAHTAAEAENAFRRVQRVFPNAGLDLIAGWPGTDDVSWRTTLARAVGLEPVHVSCYSLIREPKTRIDLAVRKGEITLPDDDAALEQIDCAAETFAAAGLMRYEVSNYAKPGFECRHNCAVWRGEDYAGLGEGAHGRKALTRTRGLAEGYEVLTVTEEEDAFERSMLGLRTAAGVNLSEVEQRFPVIAANIPQWRKTLNALVAHDIVASPSRDVFVPTHRGFEVSDAIMAELR